MNLSGGMSGCHLKMIGNGLVRKTSFSESYNERLRRQAKKQEFFERIDFRNICVPRVVATGESDNLFYFDMDYSPGLGMRDFFSQTSVLDLEFVTETLLMYLNHTKSMSRLIDCKSQIMSKIEELKVTTGRLELLDRLALMLELGGSKIPKSACHGDLTLGNMLFHKNKICLVDFLDSYIDTYLCDLAKLKQDLFYLWSPISLEFLESRVVQSCKFIWGRMEKEFGEEMETDIFKIVDTINILRIEPYVKTKSQNDALHFALKRNDIL